ncbi:telomere repeat-binding factor 2 isoform X3 [Rhododendron vialii]|uniref:telomere repeat-binding factor 2 isoform X3 n=1 Tax=Rhododendron vialii TaxID=182163 RepID=UPI00265ED505|nr:telomere repeat-binding factor 2 isoform X3 [Rhododendron vialii]
MGAPKLKWTSEEEAALKAGVAKHGPGKWSAILKDPEFRSILHSRSNVDLKDKWRNVNVAANGWGSRTRTRVSSKSHRPVVKRDDEKVLSTVVESDAEVVDDKPLDVLSGIQENGCAKKPISSLDTLILEAITKLKEPRGSSRATIALYIQIKHQYRIAPPSTLSNAKKDSPLLFLEGKHKSSSKVEKDGVQILTKSQIDAELEKMKGMTAQEAAAAAAQAVAEAEAAIAEAEEAAREAEKAEADAEAAQLFAEAAIKALESCRTVCIW